MNKSTVINTLISAVGGALVGGAITFITVKKHYKDRSNREIAEVKQYYKLVRKEANVVGIYGEMPGEADSLTAPDFDSLPRLTDEEKEEVRQYVETLGYSGDELMKIAEAKSVQPPERSQTESIFNHAVEDPGPELDGPNGRPIEPQNVVPDPEPYEETPSDDGLYTFVPGEPHIISVDDFFNTEEEWDKTALSYYKGDDTLIDDRMTIVDYRDRYIGDRHLKMFGIKSGDRNVVYVRSPQISTDFEIILEPGKASEFLGPQQNEPDEPFERRRSPQRMRDSD